MKDTALKKARVLRRGELRVGDVSLISTSEKIVDCPKVLILEPDVVVARQLLAAVERTRCWPALRMSGDDGFTTDQFSGAGSDSYRGQIIQTLYDLHATDLSRCNLVLCAIELSDGAGLDALAYLRGVRPDLPVVLTGPPGDIDLAVEAIRAGAIDYLELTSDALDSVPLVVEKCLAQHLIRQENDQLHRALSRSFTELADKNHQYQLAIEQLEQMARTDGLTGLSNRRWLNETLDRTWQEAIRNDIPLAFMMIDLDAFKLLNDEHGHVRGDELLRMTGRIIQANTRSVDLAARYGGDEFCILMPHTQAEEAVRVAHRIRRAFERAIQRISGRYTMLGMSIGVSHSQVSHPASADQLIIHADEAMYAAKSSRRQRVMIRHASGVGGATPGCLSQVQPEVGMLTSASSRRPI